jgi:hypothetical protein
VEGTSIKLTRDSAGDNQHHFIPEGWVDHVDQSVHLNKDCGAAKREWRSESTATKA